MVVFRQVDEVRADMKSNHRLLWILFFPPYLFLRCRNPANSCVWFIFYHLPISVLLTSCIISTSQKYHWLSFTGCIYWSTDKLFNTILGNVPVTPGLVRHISFHIYQSITGFHGEARQCITIARLKAPGAAGVGGLEAVIKVVQELSTKIHCLLV